MERPCPGCGVIFADCDGPGHRYVNVSPACWAAYGQVLAAEYSDALIFGACHELSVDAYIAQHAGGSHPARSVVVHLAGLYLALAQQMPPTQLPQARAKLTGHIWEGPDPVPPTRWGALTVHDLVAVAGTAQHVPTVQAFAQQVWAAWSHEHARVAAFVTGTHR